MSATVSTSAYVNDDSNDFDIPDYEFDNLCEEEYYRKRFLKDLYKEFISKYFTKEFIFSEQKIIREIIISKIEKPDLTFECVACLEEKNDKYYFKCIQCKNGIMCYGCSLLFCKSEELENNQVMKCPNCRKYQKMDISNKQTIKKIEKLDKKINLSKFVIEEGFKNELLQYGPDCWESLIEYIAKGYDESFNNISNDTFNLYIYDGIKRYDILQNLIMLGEDYDYIKNYSLSSLRNMLHDINN